MNEKKGFTENKVMAMNEYNIKALQELLSQPEDDCEYENDDLPQAGARKLGDSNKNSHANLKSKI